MMRTIAAPKRGDAATELAPADRELTPPEKAAIVIHVLGPEASAPLLERMDERDVRSFARAASMIGDLDREIVEEVVQEFMDGLDNHQAGMSPERLKALLGGVLSDDAIERLLDELEETDGRSVWEKLSNSDPIDLSNFLSREHPQTVAVVMSRVRPEAAARVLGRFEPEFAEEVVMRMSKVSMLSHEVMDSVRVSIEDDFLRGARIKKSKRKPDEMIGSIFNFLPGERRDKLLSGIGERSETLATAIQRKMFTFQDVPKRVDRASVSVVMRGVENDVLIMALAAAAKTAPETKDFFLSNMSRRLAEQFEDQISERPAPSNREGEEAMFAVINVIRELSERGDIKLIQNEEEEMDE